jgi:hypothetical protein
MQLSDFINKKIVVGLKGNDERPRPVTLLGVESGGIWIDSQEITNAIAEKEGPDPQLARLAYFFPYEQVLSVVAPKPIPGSTHSAPRE